MTDLKPMLAKELDWMKLRYPVFCSWKLDGIRCIVDGSGIPRSRTWKIIRNRHFQTEVLRAGPGVMWLDGEIVVGEANHPNVMQATTSGIMSESGTPGFTYYVFDLVADPRKQYTERLNELLRVEPELPGWCRILPQAWCKNRDEVEQLEAQALEMGYEGLIVRSPKAPYKFGRSTVNEGYLLKLKRFEDAEAVVVGTVELMRNKNPATRDALGHTVHSAHKAGMVPAGMLGALLVQDPTSGVRFSIGSGFDEATRRALWRQRLALPGRIVKYKCQPHGRLDAPRFPIFLGFRDKDDL